jgi:Uri superfamily endonuclease
MIQVGAIGVLPFMPGWYIYIGSALGSGGLQRLERHISFTRLRDKSPKWHVDYLLASPCFSLIYAVYAVTADRLECRLVCELDQGCIQKFGCSDCSCISHLMYRQNDPRQEIFTAFRKLLLDPVIKTIINEQV